VHARSADIKAYVSNMHPAAHVWTLTKEQPRLECSESQGLDSRGNRSRYLASQTIQPGADIHCEHGAITAKAMMSSVKPRAVSGIDHQVTCGQRVQIRRLFKHGHPHPAASQYLRCYSTVLAIIPWSYNHYHASAVAASEQTKRR
jgi:hypothetical protein